MEQILAIACEDSELITVMKNWDVDKIMHWVKSWDKYKISQVLAGWKHSLLGELWSHPLMPSAGKIYMAQIWNLYDEIIPILRNCTNKTIGEVIHVMFDQQ